MFGFLKKKLQDAVSIFSKKVEVEAEDVKEDPKNTTEEKEAPKEEKKQVTKEEKKVPEKKVDPVKKEVKKEEPKKAQKKEEKKEPQKAKTDTAQSIKAKPIVQKEIIEEEASEDISEPLHANIQTEQVTENPKIASTEEPEKKGFFGRFKEKFTKKEEAAEQKSLTKQTPPTEIVPEAVVQKTKEEEKPRKAIQKLEVEKKSPPPQVEEESKGFFGKIGDAFTKKKISEEKFEELFWEIEVALLEGNVAIEVIEKIKTDLKEDLVEKKVNRFDLQKIIMASLRTSLKNILTQNPIDILEKIDAKSEKPFVICFVGINGAGKTTTIGKFIKYLQNNGKTCTVAAADTFRAAALEQLQTHTDALQVKLIKHEYGSDAAAVAFDAIQYAKQKQLDCVLVDTAGRLHSNTNLMGELQKVIRVSKADFVMFVGDALTGNDAVEQAQKYNELIGVDGIILAKADVDEKGGATISTSYVIQKPVMFLGVGQRYEDFEQFDAEKILGKLGL